MAGKARMMGPGLFDNTKANSCADGPAIGGDHDSDVRQTIAKSSWTHTRCSTDVPNKFVIIALKSETGGCLAQSYGLLYRMLTF